MKISVDIFPEGCRPQLTGIKFGMMNVSGKSLCAYQFPEDEAISLEFVITKVKIFKGPGFRFVIPMFVITRISSKEIENCLCFSYKRKFSMSTLYRDVRYAGVRYIET